MRIKKLVLLETRNLSKSFGGLRAVWDVNVQIEQGTIHGLIGPNGSGKSTFFNLVTGIYQPDSGSHINFAGQDITTQSAHQIAELGVSRTFQLLRLFFRYDSSGKCDGRLSLSFTIWNSFSDFQRYKSP